MNPDPLFSIITVTYNASDCIIPTLDSVNSQKMTDFEHIIVDGVSSDNTLSLIRAASGPARRILSENDEGLYDAMNKGLKLARGKYILFLNAGDAFANPFVLEKYSEAARLDADIIYGDTLIVGPDGSVRRKRHLSAPERLTFESFSHGMLICHQAFCVRRSLAPEYDLSYRFSADYDWTIRCIRLTSSERCVNIHDIAIHYLDDGMTEKNKIASLRERYVIMKKHYGSFQTLARHLGFLPRAFARKCKSLFK